MRKLPPTDNAFTFKWNSKVKAFLEFIKTLDYVKLESPEKKAIEELKSSLKQVKRMKEGKLPKQSAKAFLNEL